MESLTLKQRLVNEAKQAPGKVIVLVGGLALASYMWAPLLIGWTKSSSALPTPPTDVMNAKSTDSATAPDESQWFHRYLEFQQTKLMEPWSASAVPMDSTSNKTVTDLPHQLLPGDAAKLTVSAVLIGGRTGHLADLNNRVIREGEQVWLDFSRESPEPTYNRPTSTHQGRWFLVTISRIQPDRIDLDIDGIVTTIPVRPTRDSQKP